MKLARLVVSGSLAASSFLFATLVAAAPTVYTSRATFETAFPGLRVETFQGKMTSAGCPSPISTDTPNNNCFDQGFLGPGFTIGGTESHATDGISLNNGAVTGNFIVTSYYSDTTVLTLNPPQLLVGFDVQTLGGGAAVLTSGTTVTVSAYDGTAALIAKTDVDTTTFFGIRSDVPVAKVQLFRSGTFAEGLDNLSFGPSFTSVSPATGGYRGGSTVTLTGTGLNASTTVSFDGVAATDVMVTGGTSITCKAPAHAAGVVDVSIQTSGVSLGKPSSFTYVAHTATAALALTPKTPRFDDEPNTFTATVTGTDPTGSVVLMEGATELKEASLAAGSADLSTVLGAGTHSVFARYKGDPFHAPVDSSPVELEVMSHPPPLGVDAGSDAGGANGSDSGRSGGAPDSSVGPGASSEDGGASAAPTADASESGCSASREAPRAPFGFAMALTLAGALAFLRRRR